MSANYDDVELVRALSQNEVNKLTNAQLKRALAAVLTAERDEESPDNNILTEIRADLREIKTRIQEVNVLKNEVQEFSTKLESAYQIIHQQQLFLESIDNRERKRNLIITGLPENANDLGADDAEKLRNVLSAANCPETIDPSSYVLRRLGKLEVNSTRSRPLHVTVETPAQREVIIEKARNLKNAGDIYSNVYIKKDIHPVVRKELGRLRKREKDEKNKPENAGTNIVYDYKKRVLLKDNIVIDRFSPMFF